MLSKDAWKKKWRLVLGGLSLYGYHSDTKLAPTAKVERAMAMPEEIERILDQMLSDLEQPTGSSNALPIAAAKQPPAAPADRRPK